MNNKILSKEEQKAADEEFRRQCKIYFIAPDNSEEEQDAWQAMFDLIYQAASSAVKMKLKLVYRADIQDVILDTTMNVANMIKNKKAKGEEFVLKNKLVSLCGPYSLFPLYGKQERFEESCYSLNSYVEDNGEACLGVYNQEYN